MNDDERAAVAQVGDDWVAAVAARDVGGIRALLTEGAALATVDLAPPT